MLLLITACGKSKENKPLPAGLLYKSSRIRYLYKKSKELQMPFYILSAEYGLISADKIIKPYERKMTEERCKEFEGKIKKIFFKLKPKLVIFYKGGSPKVYVECIEKICKELNIPFKSFGYANMGDIGKLDDLIWKNSKD